MGQDIHFELDEETDTFHVFLDGNDQGPVDMDSLRETTGKLHLHFHLYRDAPGVDDSSTRNVPDKEIEEELDELEELIEDVEENIDD